MARRTPVGLWRASRRSVARCRSRNSECLSLCGPGGVKRLSLLGYFGALFRPASVAPPFTGVGHWGDRDSAATRPALLWMRCPADCRQRSAVAVAHTSSGSVGVLVDCCRVVAIAVVPPATLVAAADKRPPEIGYGNGDGDRHCHRRATLPRAPPSLLRTSLSPRPTRRTPWREVVRPGYGAASRDAAAGAPVERARLGGRHRCARAVGEAVGFGQRW